MDSLATKKANCTCSSQFIFVEERVPVWVYFAGKALGGTKKNGQDGIARKAEESCRVMAKGQFIMKKWLLVDRTITSASQVK